MSVQVFHSIEELRRALSPLRRAGKAIGFVPTMGALHAGHGRVIEQAVREAAHVVVSIFVNPIQFDRQADYDSYPRTLSADVEFCQARSVQMVFAPSVEEIYPDGQSTLVEVSGLTRYLCGQFRPGHFRGVATVVLKLLNIVQPDRAYFGEKDAQQLAVIRRMVRDLNLPVTVVEVPTVREPDGLALSSRNQLLNAEQRRAAPALYQALRLAEERIANGATCPDEIKKAASAVLEQQPQIRVEYFEIVDPDQMQPVDRIVGPARVAGAIWLGSIRLIDNVLCRPGGVSG